MGCFMALGAIVEESPAVESKIRDPKMTLRDNPLISSADTRTSAAQREIECKNRRRLIADAEARTGVHGDVYAGIMGMRY